MGTCKNSHVGSQKSIELEHQSFPGQAAATPTTEKIKSDSGKHNQIDVKH